ncbi:MAG: NYN domain-containing protein [Shinella sp.]|nr:NYN domain-containing protein [Shinella sp.]
MGEQNTVLFIDAENMPPSLAAVILDEAKQQGFLFHRRVYGDFSRSALAPWLEVVPRHALTVCQTVAGAAGKNGADIALVIDAMDLLHTTDATVFCLATCDGDFTQLAMRIRRGGGTFVGMGTTHASARFRSACDVFKVVDAPKSQARRTARQMEPARTLAADVLQRAFVAAPPLDDEWVGLPDLMKALKACQPDFEVKAYGHSQLCKLLAVSGVELADKNRKARLRKPMLKKVVDNG